jgi:hypothetical protein
MARKRKDSPALTELEERLAEHDLGDRARKVGLVLLEIFRDKRTAKDLEHWLQQLAVDLVHKEEEHD